MYKESSHQKPKRPEDIGGHSWRTQCFVNNSKVSRKSPQNQEFCVQQKLVLKNEGEIKTFPDKPNVNEFVTCQSALQEFFKLKQKNTAK